MSNFLPLGIRHILEQTEWVPHEISVYSVLIEKGAMDLTRISLEANIGVSSVQYALRRLHAKKMVKKFLTNSKPRWKANDIDRLRQWIKGYVQQFQRHEDAAQHFIDQYDFSPDGDTAHVEFYEGIKAVQQSLRKIGEHCDSKEVLAIVSLEYDAHPELIQFMQNEYAYLRTKKGIRVKMLVAGSRNESCNAVCDVQHLIQFIAPCTNVVIHIVDDDLYIVHLAEQGPCAFTINHQPMAAILRLMFQCLWTNKDG